jgi:hypothetical protein
MTWERVLTHILCNRMYKHVLTRHGILRAQAPCTYYANEKCVSLPQCGQWEWRTHVCDSEI